MTEKVINIAKDFSRYPAGRYRSDGEFSGERFREELLLPAVNAADHIVVELDGVRGFGSSFLEEAFGGLVRKGYSPEKLKKLLDFRTEDASLPVEIQDYIDHGKE